MVNSILTRNAKVLAKATEASRVHPPPKDIEDPILVTSPIISHCEIWLLKKFTKEDVMLKRLGSYQKLHHIPIRH